MTPAFDIVTLHPDMLRPLLLTSVIGRGVQRGLVQVGIHDLRDWATDRHRTVDDAPYGGGPGMVIKIDVVGAALAALRRPDSRVLLTSPAGRVLNQQMAANLARQPHTLILCGHYEGIDARVEGLVDDMVSLGDVVLTGGEIAAAAIVDASARLVPGVLGNEASPLDESFSSGLLEYPQYTRPWSWEGQEVPEVLASGHHARIEQWRRAQAEERTRRWRPDLWERYEAARRRNQADPKADGLREVDEGASPE